MSPRKTLAVPRARKSRAGGALASLVGLLAGTGHTPRPLARTSRGYLDRHFSGRSSSLTVLVHSRDEDAAIVRSTLWAAALQEFPSVRVVHLVDDAARELDAEADDIWLLSQQIADELAAPRARFADAFMDFQQRISSPRELTVDAVYELARQYGWASGWIREWAEVEANSDAVDDYFVTHVVRTLAADLDRVRASLTSAADAGRSPTEARMLELYRRLMWTFEAELVTFERGEYDTLPRHIERATALKADGSRLGLEFEDDRAPAGTVVSAIRRRHSSDLVYPDATYILEIDPASVLVPEYALRLVFELEQPGNERIAVAQRAQSPSSTSSGRRPAAARLPKSERLDDEIDSRRVA